MSDTRSVLSLDTSRVSSNRRDEDDVGSVLHLDRTESDSESEVASQSGGESEADSEYEEYDLTNNPLYQVLSAFLEDDDGVRRCGLSFFQVPCESLPNLKLEGHFGGSFWRSLAFLAQFCNSFSYFPGSLDHLITFWNGNITSKDTALQAQSKLNTQYSRPSPTETDF